MTKPWERGPFENDPDGMFLMPVGKLHQEYISADEVNQMVDEIKRLQSKREEDAEALEVGRLVLAATNRDELCFDQLQWYLDNKKPPFSFHDEPGEHDPCYVVMPGGMTLPLNHDARPGVDIARAKWIIKLCNIALKAVAE